MQGIKKKSQLLRSQVEEMRKFITTFGGEQSGHVVIMDYDTTGDGH